MASEAEERGARKRARRALEALAVVSGLVLLASTAGLIPARKPTPPPAEPRPALATHSRLPPAEPDAGVAQPDAVQLTVFSLCDAPKERARLVALPFAGQSSTVAVSCAGGYELLAIDAGAAPATVTRLARFSLAGFGSKQAGGAVSTDLDADGLTDFLLGVSAPAGMVHAPGAGAYLVRGRAQGGFADAQVLLEAPIEGLLAVREAAAPVLYVLSRGDHAARRAAELSIFDPGPPLRQRARLPWGLSARDLTLGQLDAESEPQLFAISGDEQSITRLVRGEDGALHVERVGALSDVRELLLPLGSLGLFARTESDLHKVVRGPDGLTTQPWLSAVNVGASAIADLDRDGTPDLVGLTTTGVSFTPGAHPDRPHDLALDVGSGEGALAVELAGEPRVLLLLRAAGRLSLVLLPPRPWPLTTATRLEEHSVREAPSLAEIALE